MKRLRSFGIFIMIIAVLFISNGCNKTPSPSSSSSQSSGVSASAVSPSSETEKNSNAQGIKLGFGKTDITPNLTVQLRGQSYDRIANKVHDNLYATAMAWESASGDTQAIIVSVDNIVIDGNGLIEEVRKYVEGKLPGLQNTKNILLFCTHIHTGPWLYEWGDTKKVDTTGSEYFEFLAPKIGDAVITAWNDRKDASVGYMAGSVDAGWCRIARYKDGHDEMYGNPRDGNFVEFISGSNHNLKLLYCYQGDVLKGVVINAGFPFQTCEKETQVSADVTGRIRERFPDLYVLPIISAAGDQSPYDLTKGSIDTQTGFSAQTAIGDKIANEINRYIEDGSAKKAIKSQFIQAHRIQDIAVTRSLSYGGTDLTIELHALRLGDVVLVNNPFELYVDYGFEIKARSMAPVTLVGQLSSNYTNYAGECVYLPTAYAEEGEGYGAEGRQVGSAGGMQLVEQTVKLINELYGSKVNTLINQTDENVAFSKNWTSARDSGAYKQDRMVTGIAGSSVEFTFSGTGIKWYDSADKDKGIAEVYMDGVLQVSADEYSPILLCQKEMFRVTGLANGKHTIKIVCIGQKNKSAADGKVGVDYFVVEQLGAA